MMIEALALALANPEGATAVGDAQFQSVVQCGRLAMVDMPDDHDAKLTRVAETSWFMAQAALLEAGPDGLVGAMRRMLTTHFSAKASTAGTQPAVCRSIFPQAYSADAAALPTDKGQRNMLCFAIGSLYFGMAKAHSEATGDARPLRLAEQVQNHFLGQLMESDAKNLQLSDQAAMMRMMGQRIADSLALGNPEVVAKKCAATIS
jgi:hypothetical protein